MESKPIEFTIVVLALLFSFAEQENDGRTSPSVVFGNSNYSFHKEPPQYRNWEESRKRCKNIGSDLVSIESEKEWIFLKETIQKNAIIEYFIGLKKERSGEWRWISDNSKVNGTRGNFPWAKEEPNGDGNCAVMYKEYREYYGLFNDLSCTENRMIPGYICESSVNSNDQEVPTVEPTPYRTEGGSIGSGKKTSSRRSLAVTSAARFTTSNSPSTEAPSKDVTQQTKTETKESATKRTMPQSTTPKYFLTETYSKATPPRNVKDIPEKETIKRSTYVIIMVLTLLVFLILITLIVFYVMYVRRRNFKKQVQSRVRCTYEDTGSSPGQQTDEYGRHLGSSAADVTVHVTFSRTEAGPDTYETAGDQEGPSYANVKKTNRKSQTHGEESLTHGARIPKQTQSEDGSCMPLESTPLNATRSLEAHGV